MPEKPEVVTVANTLKRQVLGKVITDCQVFWDNIIAYPTVDEFKKEIMGYVEDKNKVLFENKDATFKPFALMFEFKGDTKKTRHVLYNANTSRGKVAGKTVADKTEVETEELSLKATPCEETGMVKASCYEGTEQYNSWFSAVYKYVQPTEAEKTKLNEEARNIKPKNKEKK